MAKVNMTLEEKLDEAIVGDGPYEVPGKWVWTNLGNLIKVSSGKGLTSKEMDSTGDIPVYGGNGFIGNHNKFIFDNYQIIIGRVGANCGNVHLTDNKSWITDNALVVSYDTESINRKYLYYLLRINDLGKYSTSTAQPVISGAKLYSIPVQLPPLKEQQRIVDRIEGLFEKLDKAKELIEEAREGFEKRKPSILERAFMGELTKNYREKKSLSSIEIYLEELKNKRVIRYNENLKTAKEKGVNKPKKNYDFIIEKDENLPPGWVKSKLDNLIYMAGRIGWKGLKASEYKVEGPMFLSVYNLNYGDDIVYSKVYHISNERYDESPEIKVNVNDILLTKDGAGIGKLGFVKELPDKATINSSLLIVRADGVVIPKYLFYFFKGPQLQRLVKERITGSAIPHLFQKDIKEFILSIPPIEEQKEIVRILDKLLQEESKIEELTQLEEQIELIKKSILAKAFRGELGTNCEEDESALELLKEILSEN